MYVYVCVCVCVCVCVNASMDCVCACVCVCVDEVKSKRQVEELIRTRFQQGMTPAVGRSYLAETKIMPLLFASLSVPGFVCVPEFIKVLGCPLETRTL